jgi:hypothetical protein
MRLPVQDRATGASWDFRQLSLPLSAYVFHDEMVRAANQRAPPRFGAAAGGGARDGRLGASYACVRGSCARI